MLLYRIAVILHVLAMALWLGHMFVWSLVTGPALKTLVPAATAEHLRERSLFLGGLGWPALAVLVVTGAIQLHYRGIGVMDLFNTDLYAGPVGNALALKLVLVLVMILYQAVMGHRRSSVAIYANMAVALIVLACSVVLVEGWG